MTKVGVLIPTRGDRPEFLKNCLRMIWNQTLKPSDILVIDEKPKDKNVDITYRYRTGYAELSKRDLDVIAFIEDDDWYSPDYLQIMTDKWLENGKPLLIGTAYTIYFHLKLRKYFIFEHTQRASAMNTMIRPNIPKIDWGLDFDPYCDLHLWTKLGSQVGDRIIFKPEKIISVGMKHGIGKTGGFGHSNSDPANDYMNRYIQDDGGLLESNLDKESLIFYNNVSKELNNV